MHRFIINGTVFTYNSNLSGDVIMNNGGKNIHINGGELKAFFANFIRLQKIANLENASNDKILGLRKK